MMKLKRLLQKLCRRLYQIVSFITRKPIHLGYSVSHRSDIIYTANDVDTVIKDIKNTKQPRNVDNIIPLPCVDVKKDS